MIFKNSENIHKYHYLFLIPSNEMKNVNNFWMVAVQSLKPAKSASQAVDLTGMAPSRQDAKEDTMQNRLLK